MSLGWSFFKLLGIIGSINFFENYFIFLSSIHEITPLRPFPIRRFHVKDPGDPRGFLLNPSGWVRKY